MIRVFTTKRNRIIKQRLTMLKCIFTLKLYLHTRRENIHKIWNNSPEISTSYTGIQQAQYKNVQFDILYIIYRLVCFFFSLPGGGKYPFGLPIATAHVVISHYKNPLLSFQLLHPGTRYRYFFGMRGLLSAEGLLLWPDHCCLMLFRHLPSFS